jgi:adenosylcobinamide kinase/adenosylcobinamide-phosphate guanylyltransferase
VIHLVTGGARSGKSSFVLAEAERAVAGPLAFVATATAGDDDMRDRIARHRDERGPRWRTVEAPVAIEAALRGDGVDGVVVDCLTLWVSNLMFTPGEDVDARTAALAEALRGAPKPVWLVTNEVGLGIVPDNEVARRYRDLLGRCNQRVAAVADRVTMLVAGLPMRLK